MQNFFRRLWGCFSDFRKRFLNLFSDSARRDFLLQKGNRHYLAGRYEQALKCYRKILRRHPFYLPALCNRANIFFFQKNYAAALADAGLMIAKFPERSCGWSLRGRTRLEQEDFAAAEADLQKALALAPEDFWNHNYLSQALQKNGHFETALEEAYRAVELSGGEDSQHLNLAFAVYEISMENGREKVLPVLRKWRRNYAGNPIVEQSCSAFFGEENCRRCNPVYVEKVFDNFAAGFDEILASLEYDSPRRIAETVRGKMPLSSWQKYRILDLGCGTGLCGKCLDSLFKKRILTGVDLSAPMLEEARRKGVYDRLEKAEIEHYLSGRNDMFDLIVSADVFTYFGMLENVFSGVFSALKKDGFFVFSITRNTENENDFFLHPSGRFAHSRNYLEKTLEKCGFPTPDFVDSVLRREGGKEVRGWVVSARK